MRAADFRVTRRTTPSSSDCTGDGELTLRVAYSLFTQRPSAGARGFPQVDVDGNARPG